ncbi:MAG: hypothetical protein EOO56_06055 [Hymenobacter sp.]|nr:MAG: hypothetical protein EOO56_06055 [Hymenobacter sp.]
MDIVQPVFGTGFYVVSLVVSGGLFFLWRRLFRRFFNSEAGVVIATAMAAIITTPIVLLALFWLWAALTRH